MAATAARPPTTPPAMAPAFVWKDFGPPVELGWELLIEVLVELLVEEVELAVGNEVGAAVRAIVVEKMALTSVLLNPPSGAFFDASPR